MMRHTIYFISFLAALCLWSGCAGGSRDAAGGELTGVGAASWTEPTPYGMVLVGRGSIKAGPQEADSIWGTRADARGVSVDAFWMDETEVTNAEYKQFVYWVRDSIIRERLADPAYGGNEEYKIEEDRDGNPVTPTSTGLRLSPGEIPTKTKPALSRAFIESIRSPGSRSLILSSSTIAMSSTIRPRL